MEPSELSPSWNRSSESSSTATGIVRLAVASPYERASLIVSNNKPFSAWTEIFGDAVAVAAMGRPAGPPRRDHQPQGDSYRLKDRRKEVTNQ